MSGAGESPRVPLDAADWWAMVGPNEREERLNAAQIDGFGLGSTTATVGPGTLAIMYDRHLRSRSTVAAITAANGRAARLGATDVAGQAEFKPVDRGIGARIGGDGEPYPEDVAIPVPIRGGLSGPRQSTPEERALASWPTVEQQTACWPPKPKAEEERAVMSDARATIDLAALAGDEVDWTPLAYRLARIPKAREAIFAAMDVEGRPWRWADTVVIAIFALVFMAAGAAALAVAAKLAS